MEPTALHTIPAGEFKAKCLSVMDMVAESGQSVVITKRGRPVARVSPIEEPAPEAPETILGRLRSLGSITATSPTPAYTLREWEELFDERWERSMRGEAQ